MTEAPTFVADRDALIQHDEQWKHLATPGHVLLARVNAYRHKSKAAFWALSAAVIVALLSQWLPTRIGAIVAWPVGKVAGLFDRKAAPLEQSPAPALRPFVAHLAPTFADPSLLPSPTVIAGALQGAAENVKTGKDIAGCDTTAKITDAWSTGDSAVPHCRYSADKSRLWVWGAMGSSYRYGAFLAVIRKDDKGVMRTLNVAGFDPVPGFAAFNPANIYPRAVAADFPELKG